jgi:hypothetical protein
VENPIRSDTKEPSLKLNNMLDEMNQSIGKAAFMVKAAYDQALEEGFSPQGAKRLLMSRLKSIKPRTILLHLPPESKDKKMRDLALKRGTLQSCSEVSQLPMKNESQSLVETSSSEVASSQEKPYTGRTAYHRFRNISSLCQEC